MRAAALAIGVDRTGHLTPLGGAVSGAEEFARWASEQGMDVTTITDAAGKVRLNDILDATEQIVGARIYDKLVVFFAGHGFLLGPQTELWLLSDAPDRGSEAINVQLSRDYARYCGIPHVIFVSDACRSGGPSHRHRSVTGGAMFPVPASYDQDGEVDTFYGTRPGDPALEFADDGEATDNYKGIFTECLLDALGGNEPAVVETTNEGAATRWLVPSRLLKGHLREAVPRRAESISIRLQQEPEVRVESDLPRFFGELGSEPRRRRGRPTARGEVTVAVRGFVESVQERAMSPDLVADLDADPTTPAQLRFVEQVRRVARSRGREAFETATGFTVYDHVRSVSTGLNLRADLWQEGEVSHVRIHDAWREPGDSILVELSDGAGTVLAVKPEFIGTVLVDEGRVVNVNYTPSRTSSLFQEEELDQVAPRLERRRSFAAAAARQGLFEIADSGAAEAGDYLRMLKKMDPTLGIYAAYAYHQAGRVKKIRSVLAYMRDDPPPVPFDVALLARLDEWPPVAPFCPMLNQGWALLDLHPPSAEALRDLRPHLIPALWTMITADGVDWVRRRLENGDLR